jgi:hypothetical protein
VRNAVPTLLLLIATTLLPASAAAQCRSQWNADLSRKIHEILADLGNEAAKRDRLGALATCTHDATYGMNIRAAFQHEKARPLLGRLLREVADIQSSARQRYLFNGDTRAAETFLQREITFRLWYLEQLSREQDAFSATDDLRRLYPESLHYLAAAYEQQGNAKTMSDLLSSSNPRLLWPATFGIWVRGVASCAAWNFKDGANATDRQLRSNMCSDDCRPAVEVLRRRVGSGLGPGTSAGLSEGEFQRVWPRIAATMKQCS